MRRSHMRLRVQTPPFRPLEIHLNEGDRDLVNSKLLAVRRSLSPKH